MPQKRKTRFTRNKLLYILTNFVKPYYLTFCKNKRIYPTADLEHDIYAFVLKHIHKYDKSRASISTYMYILVRKAFFESIRKDHLIPLPKEKATTTIINITSLDNLVTNKNKRNEGGGKGSISMPISPLSDLALDKIIDHYTYDMDLSQHQQDALHDYIRGMDDKTIQDTYNLDIGELIERIRNKL